MQHLNALIVRHNHGSVTLENVTVEPYETRTYNGRPVTWHRATGTVASGHSTNRLFSATSTTYEVPGTVQTIDLWGKSIDFWDHGRATVDLTFCG